jgi:hypothetical protein
MAACAAQPRLTNGWNGRAKPVKQTVSAVAAISKTAPISGGSSTRLSVRMPGRKRRVEGSRRALSNLAVAFGGAFHRTLQIGENEGAGTHLVVQPAFARS